MSEAGPGHNSIDAGALRGIAQRIEQLDAEIGMLNAEKSDAYKEARAIGVDPTALRAALRIKKDPAKAEATSAALERVMDALGIQASLGTPFATRDARARARGDGDDE